MILLNSLVVDNVLLESMVVEECLVMFEGCKDFWCVIFLCWFGIVMEYVDFVFYGLVVGIIFGDVFFFEVIFVIVLLFSFVIYFVGFIVCFIGVLLFGRLGDCKGWKVVMIMIISLMGVFIIMIGLILSYVFIGLWVLVCLVFLCFM